MLIRNHPLHSSIRSIKRVVFNRLDFYIKTVFHVFQAFSACDETSMNESGAQA